MSVFEKVAFKAPSYSVFDLSHDNRLTFDIGQVIDALRIDVAPGERFRISAEQLTRLAPLLAPTMQNFRLYVDSVFVPYRILGRSWEDCFNLSKSESSYPVPSFPYSVIAPVSTPNSIFDYLGYPTFDKYRDLIRASLNSSPVYPFNPFVFTPYWVEKLGVTAGKAKSDTSDLSHLTWMSIPTNGLEYMALINPMIMVADTSVTTATDATVPNHYHPVYPILYLNNHNNNLGSVTRSTSSVSSSYPSSVSPIDVSVGSSYYYSPDGDNSSTPIMPFFSWFIGQLYIKYGYRPTDLFTLLENGVDVFSELCSTYDISPSAIIDEYVNFVCNSFISGQNYAYIAEDGDFGDANRIFLPFLDTGSDMNVNLLEFLTYWRAIYDWYINTNVDGDPDDLWEDFLDEVNANNFVDYSQPFVRRWAADYFTSCFPDGSVPAVPIPSNPTVLDVRSANKMQKLEERVLYSGKRPQDQNLAIFGVLSSNARFDRTEVLSRRIFDIDINSITQTNQSELNKALKTPLGSYAGQGISVDLGQFLFDYTAEERGMIHVFVSVRPMSAYFQGLPKQFTKTSRYDFLIPQLADVGESVVKRRELYCDLGFADFGSNFGYNRQYVEYMHYPSEIHGAFRNSLRHWTGARFFDLDRARLSSSFIGVDPHASGDDTNRIFASDSPNNILLYLYFHISAVRPLSRYVNYSL